MGIIVQILLIWRRSVKRLAVILSAPGAPWTHIWFFTYYTCLGVELIFCRAGDACITYTVLNNDDERTVQIESKFCGQVELPNFPLKKVHIF